MNRVFRYIYDNGDMVTILMVDIRIIYVNKFKEFHEYIVRFKEGDDISLTADTNTEKNQLELLERTFFDGDL